ncbi:MAG TPA: SPOR domain-containing protein [Pyrinomonadaceae bacterium]|jgi:septal ring-binding cell division protein DamX
MTTHEDTHAPAAVEETAPFEAAPILSLESAPPLLLESAPTPFFYDALPVQPLELAPVEAAPLLEVTPLEVAPQPAPARPAAPTPAPKITAPDPFAVGVRLLRMAPAWLLFTTVVCGALVLALGWMKGDAAASAGRLASKQNDARAVKPIPKPEASGPKTSAANSPDVATPAAAPVVANPNNVPAPAPAEQPAPAAAKPVEKAQAEQPAPAESAGAKFTVQAGSYNSRSEANEHVSRLRAAGFESRATTAELPGRGTWYRVQVGRFAERAEASKTVAQLRAKGAASGAIVAPLQ